LYKKNVRRQNSKKFKKNKKKSRCEIKVHGISVKEKILMNKLYVTPFKNIDNISNGSFSIHCPLLIELYYCLILDFILIL